MTAQDKIESIMFMNSNACYYATATELAETTANVLDKPEWLDDSTSELWDLAAYYYQEDL